MPVELRILFLADLKICLQIGRFKNLFCQKMGVILTNRDIIIKKEIFIYPYFKFLSDTLIIYIARQYLNNYSIVFYSEDRLYARFKTYSYL